MTNEAQDKGEGEAMAIRAKGLILEIYDAMAEAIKTGKPSASIRTVA